MLGILALRGLGEFSPSGIAYGVRQGPLSRRRRVQVDERGAFGVVPHPHHEFPEVRARVGGELVPGVPQVVKVNALQADSGQGGKPGLRDRLRRHLTEPARQNPLASWLMGQSERRCIIEI